MPKTLIKLMSPVKGIESPNFSYPELYMIMNEKSGTFSFQKTILIPFSWLHLIAPLSVTELKNLKMNKAKNKSFIESEFPKKNQL